MKLVTVIGARPEFVQAAAVSPVLRARHTETLVHTGQHHDDELSAIFVEELGTPRPEVELQIAGGTNIDQVARMLPRLAELFAVEAPDAVLVYGDTNSTLSAALAANQLGLPVVHVEAGMRSFDRSMPEELNRVLVDHMSELLLCSSETAVRNLRTEGVADADVVQVGDVLADIQRVIEPRALAHAELADELDLTDRRFALVTAHRAGNVDEPARLSALVEVLLAIEMPVVFPVHPRTADRLRQTGLISRLESTPGVTLLGPLGHIDFMSLLVRADTVLTDSGGVQKQAYFAGVRCVTLRDTTEWVETVAVGWNVLVDLDAELARQAVARPLPNEHPALYGDGHAGARIVDAIEHRWPSR